MRTVRTALLVVTSLVGLSLQASYYNEAVGISALFYSAATYCAYETLNPWDCGLPCTNNGNLHEMSLIHNNEKNTFAFAGYSADQN